MKQKTLARLSKSEELLRDRLYDKVLDALSSIDRSTLPRKDCGWWNLLFSEAKLYKGLCGEVEGCLREAIEIFRHDPDTEKYALAKFLLGWMYASLGDYVSAIEAYTDANAHYDRCGNQHACARTLNKLAYPQFQMGQMDAAIRNVELSIAILRALGESDKADSFSINLASLQFRAGFLTDSIMSYLRLISDGNDKHGHRTVLILYEMVAAAFTQTGEVARARKMFSRCQPYLGTFQREDGTYYEFLGMSEIADGNYAAAEKALNKGLEISLEIAPESSLVSQIKRLFGDLYVATNKYDLAHKFATEALAVAEKINERVEIAACYRIFAQTDSNHGNDNKAREWFRKAIDLFRVIGSNYELAVTRYLAGASGLYHNGERHAILYLAREYFESEDVKPYIRKVDAELRRSKPLEYGPKKPVGNRNGHTIVARSPVMRKVIEKARSVAESNMTVLVTGETGTGKSLLARHIHNYSGRPGEFITVECTGIPEALLESELFGYEKGAFTGADALKQGRFELAQGGTLFLDEIGDISASTQVKLLRALEDRRVMRLGSVKEISLDIRIIAATNCDLQQRMKENLFRTDLYYRLNSILIDLPPLSERIEDIPAMVEHFLTNSGNGFKVNGNGPAIKRLGVLLSVPDYEGNIRELKNRVEKLLFISDGDVDRMIESVINDGLLSGREWLLRTLDQTGWNRREAARRLGVSEGTIRKRIRKFDLVPPKTDLA